MRKLMLATVAVAIALMQQSCLKDSCRQTYSIQTPIFKTLTQVRAEMRSTSPQTILATGKINLFGNTLFLNEVGKGIHVIDNSNPQAPVNKSFINVPGNLNMAVKGNYLFADSYSDVVVFDISNQANIKPVKFLNNAIAEKNVYWPTAAATQNTDLINIVVGYNRHDTTVDCATYKAITQSCPSCMTANVSTSYAAAPQSTGTGGSMASFTIVNDYLYAVGSSALYSLNISNPVAPQQTATKNLGWGIETIYPFQNKLFIGSNTGMFIFDLSTPSTPVAQGSFSHATACDPVIADDRYAYVTLRSGATCATRNTNELDVVDVSNVLAPSLKKTVTLTNPRGLAKDGNVLLVCDGKEGLKIYNARDPLNPQLLKQMTGLEAVDVIAANGLAIVVATDGLYQFDYSNPSATKQLSKLSLSK